MAETAITGQELIDLTKDRMGGYQNAVDDNVLLSFVNEGKDKVWAILKSLNTEYFLNYTQSADATKINYFGPLAVGTRQYTLPADFREVQFIEVTTSGYEQTVFIYKDINSEEFREARRDANSQGANGQNLSVLPVDYFYTIIGKDQMLLAQFPAAVMQLVIYYVRLILDLDMDTTCDEILLPYSKSIAKFAAKIAMLPLQDQPQFEEWEKEWSKEILMIASTAGPRNQANATFVEDFLG